MKQGKTIVIGAFSAIVGASPVLAHAAPLFFTATRTNQIWVAETDGSGSPSVLFNSAGLGQWGPAGIDLDQSAGMLFWGTGNHGQLWTGNADGTGTPSFVYSSFSSYELHDVEVDEANARVFFTDEERGILVGLTDGSGSMIEVYGDGTGHPQAGDPVTVAYDPAGDTIYFGGPENSGIFAGAADGSSLTTLYTASNVRDIAIDPAGGTIYWVDLDRIWAAPIDGSGIPTVLFSDLGGNLRAIEIDVASGTLFLGEFSGLTDTIWTANVDGTGSPMVIYSGNYGGIRGMTIAPEPGTLGLLILGGLLVVRRR